MIVSLCLAIVMYKYHPQRRLNRALMWREFLIFFVLFRTFTVIMTDWNPRFWGALTFFGLLLSMLYVGYSLIREHTVGDTVDE